MKAFKRFAGLTLSLILGVSTLSFAGDGGEMGVFGGISDGSNLPYTMDKYVDSGIDKKTEFTYKEYQFLSGEPVLFTGTLTVETDEVDFEKEPIGSYNETYEINATSGDDSIKKEISFITTYRVKEEAFNSQVIRNSVVDEWSETISIGGTSYTLKSGASTFSKASVEHITPGVSYYDTVISYNANYDDGSGEYTTVNSSGNVYGYTQPWSKVETQNISMNILSSGWQMSVKVKPFMASNKTLYYDETKPFPISFGGTYNQRLSRESVMTYEILVADTNISQDIKKGQSRITSANIIEKLPIPEDLDFLTGHWAEDDIKKLYSMEILTEYPRQGMQYEAMTRGEYVKALCLAMDIDLSKYEKITDKSPQIFNDVEPEHSLYKYIMAAYDAKLIKGVGVNFNVNAPITRQEAFVIYIRVIGLERLGITNIPITPFIDDSDIASWAKKEIMAGYKLGIIKGTSEGKVQPTRWINKAESAAIINRLIDYLREEISRDYK